MSGLSIRRRRLPLPRRRLFRVLLFLIGLWLIFDCVLAGVIYVYGLADHARPAEVIVVLGSGLNPDLSPSPGLIRRAERAAELWKALYAPDIICSGGFTYSDQRSEADGCAQVLRENGVPADAILIEDRSRSTEENAIYSHAVMQAHGWTSALVVSDGYHLLRATWLFSSQGIAVSTSPCAPPPLITLLYGLAREVVALHWQVIKTALGLPYSYVPWL